MEQIISGANFMHTEDDDSRHAFTETADRWYRANSENLTLSGVLNSLKALMDKVCRPDFPHESSSGYYMVYHLLRTIRSMIDDLIGEGKAKPRDFQDLYFEFINRMIAVGPLSSHVEYIDTLMSDREVEFEDYFQGLRGEPLKRFVLALKKDYKGDPTLEREKYLSSSLDLFWRNILSSFSEEQLATVREEFLDLYMFFNHGFRDRDEVTYKAMHRVAYHIDCQFGREIFKCGGPPDVQVLTRHFKGLADVILSPGFPQSKEVAKEAKDDLSTILKIVSEEGLIGKMYEAIMHLSLQLTISKAGCVETRPHFETIGYFFFHINENGVKNNGALFEGLMQKFIHFLDNVRDESYLTVKFVQPVMYDCLNKAMGVSDSHVRMWIDMIKALLKHSVPNCVDTAHRAMREQEKQLKWKKYPDDIREIFDLLSDISFPKWLTEEQQEEGLERMEDLAERLLDEAKKVGIAKLNMTEKMMKVVYHFVAMRKEAASSLAREIADRIEFNQKKDKELILEALQWVTSVLEDGSYDLEDDECRDLGALLLSMVDNALSAVKDGKYFTWDEYDDLIYLCKLLQAKVMDANEPGSNHYFNIYVNCSFKISNWLSTMNESHRLIPLIPGVMQMLECEDDTVQRTANSFMAMISHTSGPLFARYLDKIIQMFLDKEESELLMVIWNGCEYNLPAVEKHFDALFEYVDSGNSSIHSYILQVLQKMAKFQPQVYTKDKVKVIVKEAKEEQLQQVMFLMILNDIAKKNLDAMEPFLDDFLNPSHWQEMSRYHVTAILQMYALKSEEHAVKVADYLLKRTTTSSDHNEILYSLNACRLIGFKFRPAMEKHRGTLEKFKETTTNNDLHTSVVAILDMLDGKSLDKIAEELREVQGDVAELEVRVTGVEQDVSEVKDDVQRQGRDLHNVKGQVSDQGQRLEQVKETVADTAAKVQEIDGKTLSHAPYWSRDVSRLLNVEADNDWRLLSLRLGFSNDDIRAWAQQADPCMAMLNEWYATHKTREATHAVLTSLQLLDREDAAVIVENAMKNADAVVEDEDFEYASPPQLFLSYQWGHQSEVRLLRQHLEMAGFSCWMDVGQMGGGDKLFQKIDSGVRGAKMVLSCVTAKYAKSPNCNREVNLAVNLGKPIIPLLMEKLQWPPPGSMGPIFSEYLFIRFFQRAGEETADKDQRYWPLPKFQELLMQLAQIGVQPDQQAVQPEYKNWWVPKVEEIIIDKDRAKKQASSAPAASALDEKAADSPDVFISYQWGKQPQILKLYRTLSSLGYSCWLDIMQMGGGDSLYDKIDRGLRGSRVVLSCVTAKYAKSANCRREVSLADALKKPLIPLLLETMDWPPPGPMSPILTQLLYVNCTRDNLEETWTGPKFDEILAKINQHAPRPVTSGDEKQESSKKDSSEKSPPKPTEEPRKKSQTQPPPPSTKEANERKVSPATVEETGAGDAAPKAQVQDPVPKRAVAPVGAAPKTEDGDRQESRPEKFSSRPVEQTRNGRKHSEAESADSANVGHDGFNSGAQHLTANGMMATPPSNCCSIL